MSFERLTRVSPEPRPLSKTLYFGEESESHQSVVGETTRSASAGKTHKPSHLNPTPNQTLLYVILKQIHLKFLYTCLDAATPQNINSISTEEYILQNKLVTGLFICSSVMLRWSFVFLSNPFKGNIHENFSLEPFHLIIYRRGFVKLMVIKILKKVKIMNIFSLARRIEGRVRLIVFMVRIHRG